MKTKIILLILCLIGAAVFGISCNGAPNDNYPTLEEAMPMLNQAIFYAKANDLQGLGDLAQDEPMAESLLKSAGGWDAVPQDDPQLVDNYILLTVHLKNGSWSPGGRLLVLEGIDGLGRPYRTHFMVFREGEELVVANVIYWDNVPIQQPDENGHYYTGNRTLTPIPE